MFKKKIYGALFISIFVAVLTVSQNALAHGAQDTSGNGPITIMEIMEDQMMGDEAHEQMEELMEQMIAGELTAEGQEEMIRLMQDEMGGVGAQTLMMRGMMQNPGLFQPAGFTMMGGGVTFTTILIWTFLILGIIYFVQQLIKKK